uniref:Endothelin-converting enzyme 1 n=1 Tax=Clastoptera arizonana TaxID=38151 RepID=A0A1B6D4L9_9HEMI
MLATALLLLPTAVLAIAIFKVGPNTQRNNEHRPARPESLSYNEMNEHSDHDLLQDYKTSCIPSSSSYLVPLRKRRDAEDKLNFSKQNDLQDEIIWSIPNKKQITARYLPFRSYNNEINTAFSSRISNSSNTESNTTKIKEMRQVDDGHKNKNSATSQDQSDLSLTQGEENQPHVIYDGEAGVGNQDFPWDKSEHQEEDKIEKDPLSESIIPDAAYTQQHAFWKGEGNKKAIRESQSLLMKQYMDFNEDPCHDFYQYACGNWGKLNPIPQDKAAFDTFEVLRESLDSVLKELLESKITEKDNIAYVKAKHLYKSCMNNDILERRKEQPLMTLLDELGGWPIIKPDWDPSQFNWIRLMANLRLYNNDILISEWVGPDIKNSDEYIIQFDQTSLGLPMRDYYLQESNSPYLNAYKEYLSKIAILLGADEEKVHIQADEIINFETELAKITSAPDDRRNVSELYRRTTVGELRSSIPQVDWQQYLTLVLDRECNHTEPVVIFASRYVQDLVSLLDRTPSRTISNYLLWRFIRHRVNNLDDRFQDVKQKFYFVLFGREKSPPRWKNCVTQVNSNLGMAVGAMFVDKYFDEYSKNDTLVMTKKIQQAFQDNLDIINWIDPETKLIASDKVKAMMLRIGYPDFILDPNQLEARYRDVDIYPDKYFENTLNILRHLTRVEQSNLGCSVNKTLWNTAPAVVNAYYSRNKNQIMVPAGILQPPFYHRYFPKSLNYGGIGVVIGHEITHGFDDKGRLFDKNGNLHRWWKEEAINNFHERAQCLIEQYSKYVVQEVGLPIDGINTQGENIADNGGIKEAFRAYQHWLQRNNNVDETLPGLNATGLQLFYLNFAQVWCGSARPEATRNKLKTAVHSPGKFRVIGTLTNSKDFSEVFNCPVGSPMNPTKKCSVW